MKRAVEARGSGEPEFVDIPEHIDSIIKQSYLTFTKYNAVSVKIFTYFCLIPSLSSLHL